MPGPDGLSITTGGLFTPQGLQLATSGLFTTSINPDLHPRTRIRQYIVQKLRVAATGAEERVHAERVDPIQARDQKWDLPAVNVYTRDETSEVWSESPRTYKRVVEVVIDCIVGARDAEDQVDKLALEIEQLISPDLRLGQWADDVVLRATPTDFDGAGLKKFGVARVTYLVTYGTEAVVEPVEPLLTIRNEWNFTAPDAQAEAVDQIDFEET